MLQQYNWLSIVLCSCGHRIESSLFNPLGCGLWFNLLNPNIKDTWDRQYTCMLVNLTTWRLLHISHMTFTICIGKCTWLPFLPVILGGRNGGARSAFKITYLPFIEEGYSQKRRQRSSLFCLEDELDCRTNHLAARMIRNKKFWGEHPFW